MFCSECGHELPNNAKFCSNCGLKQNEEGFEKSKDSINQDIEHSNSKKEPKLPSELDYETSYSDLISSGDEVADLPGDALLQKNPAPNDGKAIVFIGGVILSIVILIIFLASITDSSYEVAEVVYDGCCLVLSRTWAVLLLVLMAADLSRLIVLVTTVVF